MTARRKTDKIIDSKFSVSKAIIVITIVSAVALAFVHKEVKIDQAAREVKALQEGSSRLQVKLAELQIEIEKLTSFPRISRQAASLGLLPLKRKPIIVNVSSSEIPVEFSREIKLIKSDN